MMIRAIGTAVVVVLMAGCAKEEVDTKVPDGVINQSLAMFDGMVIDQGSTQESGQSLWMVKIRNGESAIVSLFWSEEETSLHRIEGSTGPYDENYDVLPGNGLINFRSAELAARSALKNSDLNNWRLTREEAFSDLWVYTLVYNRAAGTSESAYISASSGNVLAVD